MWGLRGPIGDPLWIVGIGALHARCRDRGVLRQRCRRCWELQEWLWECSRGPARHGEGMGFSRRSWEPQGRCGVVRVLMDVWGVMGATEVL